MENLISVKINVVFHMLQGNGEYMYLGGLPSWFSGKESTCNAGDTGLIPGSGRSLGEGNGNPFQYYCLGNLMDRGAWQASVHGVARVD